jgi:CBS-domain-containing membrane protein
MFSVYGLSGPVFHGTLEELGRIPQVTRRSQVRAVERVGENLGAQFNAALPPGVHITETGEQAIKAYQQTLQVDQERGPLYHADQIMQRHVITVAAGDAIEHAWRVLIEHEIHQAPVLDAGQGLVGIVSERDLLTTINVEDGRVRDVLARSVRDVMSTPVVSAGPQTDIRLIANVMLTHKVDGVPIVSDDARLVGFISRSDVLRAIITDPPLSLWR